MDYQISTDEWRELLHLLKSREQILKKGEMILRQEQPRPLIGCVFSGLVYLCAENEMADRSILCFFREGDYISSSMLVQPEHGLSYLTAKSSARIAWFLQDDLLKLCLENSKWMFRMFRFFSEQEEYIRACQGYMLRQKTVRGRLLAFLKMEQDKQGINPITVPIPFSDLADYLAADRTAIMKELRLLKEEGMIAGSRGTLTILK